MYVQATSTKCVYLQGKKVGYLSAKFKAWERWTSRHLKPFSQKGTLISARTLREKWSAQGEDLRFD